MIIFRRKQEPIVIVRMTDPPYGSARIDLVPHSIEGPTTSYLTPDGEFRSRCSDSGGAGRDEGWRDTAWAQTTADVAGSSGARG